jgi:hypothetical protein
MNLNVISPVLLAGILLSSGCASQTRVYFGNPERTQVFLPGKKVAIVMPVESKLDQTDSPEARNLDVGGRPIRMVLPDGTKLKGFVYVYKSNLDQLEGLLVYRFDLSAEQIEKLHQGQAVTVSGSSSKDKPVYKITLGIDLE